MYLRVLTKVFTSYLLQYLRVLTKVFTSYSLQYLRVLTKVFTSYSLMYLRVLTKVFTSYSLQYLRVLTKVFTSYSLMYLRVLTKVFTSYSLMYLRVLIETSTSYSFYCCCYWRAPRGRYSCKAQGASPGFSELKHLLSRFRGGTSARVLGVVVVLCLLRCIYPLGYWLAKVSTAPTELNPLLSVFPQGFISGFALIPPWALRECRPCRALCTLLLFPQGFISGFALIPPWALQGCRPCRALCMLLLFPQGFISGFALISPWALREYRPFRTLCRIGRLRCCVVVLCSLNVFGCVNGLLRSFVFFVFVWLWLYCLWYWGDCLVELLVRSSNEPQGGDTPAKPRAQALGSVC